MSMSTETYYRFGQKFSKINQINQNFNQTSVIIDNMFFLNDRVDQMIWHLKPWQIYDDHDSILFRALSIVLAVYSIY